MGTEETAQLRYASMNIGTQFLNIHVYIDASLLAMKKGLNRERGKSMYSIMVINIRRPSLAQHVPSNHVSHTYIISTQNKESYISTYS
jgi:hypothetical protein